MVTIAHEALKIYARRFPLERGKRRIVSRLWQSVTSEPYVRDCTLKQAPIRMRCDLTKYIQRQLYFFGSYESSSCAYWMKQAAAGDIIFDAGANVGLYSLLAAAVNPAASIHAFEPSSEVAAAFRTNITLNAIDSIVVNELAVAASDGRVFLHHCSGDSHDNEGMNFVLSEGAESTITIESVSLDSYCKNMMIDRIDLLKLDIEGGEYEALLGASELLRGHNVRCILLELVEWAAGRSGHSVLGIQEVLQEFGYRLYTLGADHLDPLPVPATNFSGDAIALPFES